MRGPRAERDDAPLPMPFLNPAESRPGPPSPLQRLAGHRDLLALWIRRGIRDRYYETKLGPLWLVLQPLLMTAVFTVAFTVIARVGSRGAPYPLFFLIGFIPWNYFAFSLGRSSTAITANLQLIRHHAFPRELLILAVLASALPDVLVGVGFTLALLFAYSLPLTPAMLLVVPIFLVQMLLVFGCALWVSTLNALWRDVHAFLPSATRGLFYLSPIIYPVARVPESIRDIYLYNPIAALTVSYRDVVLGGALEHPRHLLVAAGVSVFLMLSGYWYFRRVEHRFADLI